MNQHSRTFIRTMMQERYNSGIVEIFLANVISDLHSKMARAHASG